MPSDRAVLPTTPKTIRARVESATSVSHQDRGAARLLGCWSIGRRVCTRFVSWARQSDQDLLDGLDKTNASGISSRLADSGVLALFDGRLSGYSLFEAADLGGQVDVSKLV